MVCDRKLAIAWLYHDKVIRDLNHPQPNSHLGFGLAREC